MKKKIIIGTCVIAVCLAGGWYYWSQNTSAVIDSPMKQISEIIQGEKEKTENPQDQGNSSEQAGSATNTGEAQPNAPQQASGSQQQKSPNATAAPVLSNKENEIVSKYKPQFLDLEKRAENDLSSLAAQAKSAFQSQGGNKTMAALKIAGEYIPKAKKLEKNYDGEFNSILGKMKAELKQHNLPMTAADEAQSEYNAKKSESMNHFMDQAKKAM